MIAFVGTEALGIRHSLDLDPDASWVKVDRIQIQQVLINLVRNAIEAMADSEWREIRITTRTKGAMVEVEVAGGRDGGRKLWLEVDNVTFY